MKKNRTIMAAWLAIGILSLTIAAKDKPAAEGVLLKADYSAKQQVKYSVQYTSQGNFRQKSSNTAKTTQIKCMLNAAKKENMLGIKVERIVVTSDVYDQETQDDIRGKLVAKPYNLSLAKGFPSLDTSMEIPETNYLEWDLYRQLSKLLPMLPAKPVKPGFTWERTDVFPMNTPRGKVSCEVYRNYTFNVLAGDSAMISWKFRYAGGGKADSSALKEVPVFGTGNGSAVLDIKNGCIVNAEMNFTTPVAVVGDVTVVWHENAVIKLTEEK